jgi:hypothetical protein
MTESDMVLGMTRANVLTWINVLNPNTGIYLSSEEHGESYAR